MKNQNNNYLYNPLIGNFLSWFAGVAIMALYVNGYVDHSGPMIIGVFVGSFWTVRLHAYRQAEAISKGKYPNHDKLFILRCLVALTIGFSIHALADGINGGSALKAILCALYMGGIFWLLFDSIIGLDLGKGLLYIPTPNEGTTSRTDRFFYRRKWLWLISKPVVFLLTMWLYKMSF